MNLFRLASVVLTICLLNSCSSDKDVIPPAELKPFTAEFKFKKLWSRGVGDGQGERWNNLQLAVDERNIFAASSNGKVYAFDKKSGKKIWNTNLKNKVISGATGLAGNLVLVGTLQGEIIALDKMTGSKKWQAEVGSEILSAPVANADIVVVQSQDDGISAFNITDGKRLWVVDNQNAVLSLRGTSKPVVTNLLVVAGLSSGKVIAVNAQTGSVVWEQRIAAGSGRTELERMIDIDGNLRLSGNSLYAVSYQGKAAAFDLETGAFLWQKSASSYVGVAEHMGTVVIVHADGVLESFNESNQDVIWQSRLLHMRGLSAPVIYKDYVLVGDFEGYLHALHLDDGTMLARIKIGGGGIYAPVLVSDDVIYTFANNGKLVALQLVRDK